MLGEHSRQVLMDELGYSGAEVDALVSADVVRVARAGAAEVA
jgi:hypothetical protein